MSVICKTLEDEIFLTSPTSSPLVNLSRPDIAEEFRSLLVASSSYPCELLTHVASPSPPPLLPFLHSPPCLWPLLPSIATPTRAICFHHLSVITSTCCRTNLRVTSSGRFPIDAPVPEDLLALLLYFTPAPAEAHRVRLFIRVCCETCERTLVRYTLRVLPPPNAQLPLLLRLLLRN